MKRRNLKKKVLSVCLITAMTFGTTGAEFNITYAETPNINVDEFDSKLQITQYTQKTEEQPKLDETQSTEEQTKVEETQKVEEASPVEETIIYDKLVMPVGEANQEPGPISRMENYQKFDFGGGVQGRIDNNVLIVEKIDASASGRMNDFDATTSPIYHVSGFDKIIIGKGIEYIGKHAFERDPMISNLVEVQVGNSVKEIGDWAFNSNVVHSLTFEDNSSLEKIDTGAFHNNAGLNGEVILPASVKVIEGSAFKDCDISKLTIGSSVENIGATAFSGNKLTELVIPDNVKVIEEQAFRNNELTNITIGSGITEIAPYLFIQNKLTNISLPSQIEKIGSNAFSENQLESVVLDGNVKTIGGDAFSENKIKSVVLGDSVETIGECAFIRNEISSLTIGNGLKTIGEAVFGMNKLTTLNIPNNVQKIGSGAFLYNDITKVKIGESTIVEEDIKEGGQVGGTVSQKLGFKDVYDVQTEKAGTYLWNADSSKWEKQAEQKSEIDFGGGITGKLENGIFNVSKTDANGSGIMNDFTKGASPINSLEGINKVVIGDGVVQIGEWAFSKASDKKISGSVTIGNSVETIGNFAFSGNSITDVSFGNKLKKLGMGSFMENNLKVVNFPNNVNEIREAAFWKNPIREVNIGNGVDVATEVMSGEGILAPIGNTYGFWNTYINLEHSASGKYVWNLDKGVWEREAAYDFGGGITGKLENGTFTVSKTDANGSGIMNDFTLSSAPIYALEGINDVVIGDGVQYIGKCAFYKDQTKPIAGKVVIGDSVKSIGEKAFHNNRISDLKLGENLEVIETDAFAHAGLKNDIIIPNSVKLIKDQAFADNEIKVLTIGTGVTEIGSNAFTSNQIEHLIIPNTVKKLGNSAFAYNAIKDVSIGTGIEVIAKNTFARNKLENVIIGENVKSIGETAFTRNTLKQVKLNDKLESIGAAAFSQNEIKSLKIGNNVKSIMDDAFMFNQIEELELGENLETIEPYVFGFNKITTVKFPSNLKNIKKAAFYKNPIELIKIGDGVEISVDEEEHGPEEGNMASPTGTNIGFKALYDSENVKEGTYMWNKETSKWEKKVEQVGYDFGGGITGKLENGTLTVSKTDASGSGQMNDFQIGKSPIFKTEGIKNIVIGENIKYIGENAFNYKALDTVVLGKNVEIIGESAFKGCGLKEILIPESVKIIDIAAFAGNNLNYIKIPDEVSEIGAAAFYANPITKIEIGANAKIRTYASAELSDIDTFGNYIGFKLVYDNDNTKQGTYNWNKETSKWEKYVSKPSGGGSSGSSVGGSYNEAITMPVNTANEIKKGIVEVKKTEDGKNIAEVSIVSDFIKDKIVDMSKQKETDKVIKIEVSDTTLDTGKYIFDADVIKTLSESDCTISFGLGDVEYKISAQDLDIKDVMKKLNITEDKLSDVKLSIKIEKLPQTYTNPYEAVSPKDEFITEAVEFDISASSTTGETKVADIKQFADYVEREVQIPEGVDPSKITTGVVLNENGTYSHIPTEVFEKNGKYYAKINSLTNSAYSVIWNPVEVKSVKGHWSESAVNDMASRLIIKNPESFKADNAITRADFADYIVRALGLYRSGEEGNTKFTDIKVSSELAASIKIASDRGIINGYPDGTFRPNDNITRQEAMAMYAKAMEIVNLDDVDNSKIETYKDRKQVASWAYDSVQKTVGAGVFNGRSSNRISPKGTFTYAEAATAIRNLLVKSNLINN